MDHNVARVDNDRPKLRETARGRNETELDVFDILFIEGLRLLERSDVRRREDGAVGHQSAGETVLDPGHDLLVREVLGLGQLSETLSADQVGLPGAGLIVGIRGRLDCVPQGLLSERGLCVASSPREAPAALVESLGLRKGCRGRAQLASHAPSIGAAACSSEGLSDLFGELLDLLLHGGWDELGGCEWARRILELRRRFVCLGAPRNIRARQRFDEEDAIELGLEASQATELVNARSRELVGVRAVDRMRPGGADVHVAQGGRGGLG